MQPDEPQNQNHHAFCCVLVGRSLSHGLSPESCKHVQGPFEGFLPLPSLLQEAAEEWQQSRTPIPITKPQFKRNDKAKPSKSQSPIASCNMAKRRSGQNRKQEVTTRKAGVLKPKETWKAKSCAWEKLPPATS